MADVLLVAGLVVEVLPETALVQVRAGVRGVASWGKVLAVRRLAGGLWAMGLGV
ncbi:hypothetical protein [Nonomuraea lactucae]|uniref:hypothetical protein n=1 Tax=Nonomuraea lactucae TaxID=2249762 RepID=UPI0013B38B1F|nr:hypothetical protein [Nonomuraea lactucae]